MAGLSTPLHLAASLLGLAAATGLAIAVLVASPPARVRGADVWFRSMTALGALCIAVGSGMAGALVDNAGQTVGWLRAGGLTLIAAGLSSRRLRLLSGPAALAPFAPVAPGPFIPEPAPVVAAVAGGLAALRGLAGGWRTALVGLALACWAPAGIIRITEPDAAACLDIAGAVLLGGWLWQASARRVLAKLVTAFVAALLIVVVLLAAVLSSVGTSQLVADQLGRLSDFSQQLASEIAAEWPGDAIRSAKAVSPAGERFLQLRPEDQPQLQSLYQLSFSNQDFFVTLDETGRPANWYAPSADVITSSFLLSISGSQLVDRVLTETSTAGSLVTIGGRILALGGVRLLPENSRPEDPALGVIVTGRLVDARWAASEAAERGIGLAVEVGDRISTASPGIPAPDLVPPGGLPPPGVVTVGERTFYRAGAEILDSDSGRAVGRLYAIGTADAIADIERLQARRLFLLALLGAVFAAGIGAITSRRLVSPIRSLTAAAVAVREGDLAARPRITTNDEVGDLGRTFNEMTASLAAQSAALREAANVQARLRARLEALTASMSDALVAVDSDGKIVTFNPAAERLVGRDVADVSGLPLEEVLVGRGPGDVDAAEALGEPYGQEVIAAQILLASPHGGWVPTSVTAAPVRDPSGRVLGRVFVLRDVTRESELERMKTEFLANVSHELRTPLTPIRGYAEVLARRDVGHESTRKFAEQILTSTARLERIVGMIVDFAALDSGRLMPRPEPVDVAELVDQVLAAWREREPERHFRSHVPTTLPPVYVDRAMLVRCLDELLDNAVKFSPSGGTIRLEAKSASSSNGRPGRSVQIIVTDEGIGIEPENLSKIFSDFHQLDGSATRTYGGLGLGLAFVHRIVEAHDGSIDVSSQPEKGTRLTISIPAAGRSDRN